MAKIYIVKSSSGQYEDFHEWNEKAFNNKAEAEAYAKELDSQHYGRPDFITDDFISEHSNVIPPEWPEPPCKPADNKEEYDSWIQEMTRRDRQFIIDEMYRQGFLVTEHMLDEYEEWEYNQYEDWHNCRVEELELL